MQLAVACRATTMPCRSISLIQWIYCKFGEFICVVTPPISRHVDPHFFSTRETREASPLRAIAHCVSDTASADWPRIARVLIKRMREAFHLEFPWSMFTASRAQSDNFEITSKTRSKNEEQSE